MKDLIQRIKRRCLENIAGLVIKMKPEKYYLIQYGKNNIRLFMPVKGSLAKYIKSLCKANLVIYNIWKITKSEFREINEVGD